MGLHKKSSRHKTQEGKYGCAGSKGQDNDQTETIKNKLTQQANSNMIQEVVSLVESHLVSKGCQFSIPISSLKHAD